MTRRDLFAVAGGIITGLTLYLLVRYRERALAYAEALGLRSVR